MYTRNNPTESKEPQPKGCGKEGTMCVGKAELQARAGNPEPRQEEPSNNTLRHNNTIIIIITGTMSCGNK